MRSGIAVAVRAGAPRPDIASEDAVRQAVLAARTVSYSTGPSGDAPHAACSSAGASRTPSSRASSQAPPGVPVASLVADGRVELGFQQLAELMHVEGVDVLGPLPPAIQVDDDVRRRRGGDVGAGTTTVRAMLAFMASPSADAAKRRHGMEPAPFAVH